MPPLAGYSMSDTIRTSSHTRRPLSWAVCLLLALLPIIANAFVALFSVNEQRGANVRVERALQAMLLLKEVENLAQDSARDQRLYRLFGDPRRLDAYRIARQELPGVLSQLPALVAEGVLRADRVDRLASMVRQDSAALSASLAPIELDSGIQSVPPDMTADMARTTAIVAAVDELLGDAGRLLDEHLAGIGSRDTVALIAVSLGVVASVTLIILVFGMMRRDLHRSERLAATHSDALRESELRFRRVFEESPLGILLADNENQRIVQANPAFCRMLGADPEHIAGRTIGDLAHVDDRELLNDAIRHGTGPDLGIEVRYVADSGAIAWAGVHLTQLSELAGRPGLLLALTEDITREKRVEAELRQAQKMEAIGQLTGGIAHDFNNLLGIIIGNVEFLLDTVRDDEQATMAKEILDSALSGADLTRRLLAFARRQTLQVRRIDLNDYLPNHITILRRLVGESIMITETLADDLWPIRADPSQVGDALLNLAINARDAMPHGGTLTVATANVHLEQGELDGEVTAGDFVVLSVADSGTGMPPEVLERVVEPFFTTKGPGAGSGLGLSMIFGFARQSGGHLRIASKLGHGTTVRLYLPRADAMEPYQVDEVSHASLPQGNESILLVDDNAEMRTVARRHLVSLGYRVSEAGGGQAALEILLAGNIFDLLLTDLVMPDGMTGHQLAAAARHLRPGMKVLFTTGYSRSEPSDDLGGAVLRKPYRKQELATAVRAALEA
jgi:PAS domain S-box-containing protein